MSAEAVEVAEARTDPFIAATVAHRAQCPLNSRILAHFGPSGSEFSFIFSQRSLQAAGAECEKGGPAAKKL